jgi:hypothetical protein
VSYTSTKRGQASTSVTKSAVLGDDVYLVYARPDPTVYDPSAFKCFTTGMGGVEAVRIEREKRGDLIMTDWSENIQKTGAAAIKRLSIK